MAHLPVILGASKMKNPRTSPPPLACPTHGLPPCWGRDALVAPAASVNPSPYLLV